MNVQTLLQKPIHIWFGWIGTIIAITDYGSFSAGLISEFWFFSVGIVASVLIAGANLKDKVYYGATLQIIFIVFNSIGALRAMNG